MVRPFRFTPPSVPASTLVRGRLLTRISQRWEHRVTTIVAGPGFGKTVLLCGALADNLLDPAGEDVWLQCEPADVDAERLLAGLAQALGAGEVSGAGDLCDEVWARAPGEVCLVLDDVHEVPEGSSGAELLAWLVDELPANGHLVMASRLAPPVPVARLSVAGHLVRLGEHDLALTSDELGEFAALRGVDVSVLAQSGGWPALAELSATAGADLVADFLWEEVLTRVGDRVAALARLAVVGGADDELLSEVASEPLRMVDLLAGVPLVQTSPQGWACLHPLWEPVLRRVLAPADANECRRGAAAVHRRNGRFGSAVDLLAEAEDWDGVLDVMRQAALLWRTPTEIPELARWYQLLPPGMRDEPEALLVAGLLRPTDDPDGAVGVFRAAGERFRKRDDLDGEMAALSQEAAVLWWHHRLDEMARLVGRTVELAEAGADLAGQVVDLAHAVVASMIGDTAGVFSAVRSGGSQPGDDLETFRHWLRATAYLQQGEVVPALDVLARAPAHTVLARLLVERTRLDALWLAGEITDVPAGLEAVLDQQEQVGIRQEVLSTRLLLSRRYSVLGDDRGTALLDAAGPLLPDDLGPPMRVALALAEAASAVGAGDEERGGAALRAELDRSPIETPGTGHLWRPAVALVRRLVPETADAWSAEPLGPAHLPGLQLVELLFAARSGSYDAFAGFTWPSTGVVRAHLPVRWIAELAAAGMAAGFPAPADLLAGDAGPSLRPWLHAVVDDGRAERRTVEAARVLLRSLPPRPPYQLRVCVLGPLELFRDGQPLDHPHLRRERVRELMCFLVAHRRCTRQEVATALWPELVDGGRNLRVTLSYLQQVLQPDRRTGDPPAFVRQDGPWLSLAGDGHLEVDAWEFDDLLDRANVAEGSRTPSVALQVYREALALYRGDHLADVPHADWAQAPRTRLRSRFVSAAVRAGNLLLAAGEIPEARQAAEQALTADPWSEPAHGLLVRTHLAQGDRGAARRAWQACQAALMDLGVPPGPETVALGRTVTSSLTAG